MRIEKKCWPDLFDEVESGRKSFDMRVADFDCSPGDTIVLKEWDPGTASFTGRVLEKEITFVLRTKGTPFWKEDDVEKHGFLVMSLK